MMSYCDVCGKEVNTRIVSRQESYTVMGESVTVTAQILTCVACGEELFCEEFDSQTLIHAYNAYRKRHNLLLPEEIKNIREQYGLSQRAFGRLLHWGDKTIYRYENGAVQDRAHNNMLVFLRNPENMRAYLEDNSSALDDRQRIKVLHAIDQLGRGGRLPALRSMFAAEPSDENGYREFDYDKVCAMVLFYASQGDALLKTKLMKLLNYADMVYYKENGISISGMRYLHRPYGPVPDKADILLGMMQEDRIAHIDVVYDNGCEWHQVVADKELPPGILSESELAMLERIYRRFERYGSKDISEYSHKERGYCDTAQGEVISYSYAQYIDLDELNKEHSQ